MGQSRLPINKKIATVSMLLAVFSVTIIKYQAVLNAVGSFLIISTVLKPADIIHVIAGEEHRALYGIKLYKGGYAKLLFFTGGWCDKHKVYQGERSKRLAMANGLPQTVIVADDAPVTTTYAEAIRLKRFIEGRHAKIASVIVVSDPYHMRRVRWIYRKVLGDGFKVELAPVPFGLSPYTRQWWRQKASRHFVIYEYVKIPYYYVRYQFSFGPLKKWLAKLDRY